MDAITKYPAGTFSWIDLMSTDQEGAKKFYSELFGWTINDMPMGEGAVYTMFQIDGKDVAAVSQMDQEQMSQGMSSYWNSYVTVENADATTEKAKSLGGTIVAGPFDVFDAGRMAVIQDPTGAMISVWQAKNHVGAQLANVTGAFTWNELATRDTAKAAEFYTGLFGWTAQEMEMDNGTYTSWLNNGRSNGGMMQMDDSWGPVPPHWGVYIAVTDIDATVEKAKELGGAVNFGPMDAGDIGKFASIRDPQGGTFTAIQLVQADSIPADWTA